MQGGNCGEKVRLKRRDGTVTKKVIAKRDRVATQIPR